MGEQAEYALEAWRQAGMPDSTPRKRRVPVSCPLCGRECYGEAALMQHENAKHGEKHSMLEIDVTRDKEIYGN